MRQPQKPLQFSTRPGWTLAAALAVVVSLPLAAAGMAHHPAGSPAPGPTTPATLTAITADDDGRPPRTTLSGSVKDQTGGTLPGATVTVTNQQTHEPYVSVTNVAGGFSFGNLPPATYELVVQLSGFRRIAMPLDLSTGTPVNITLTLPIGALTEEITVQCETAASTVLQMFFPALSAQERPAAPIRVGGNVKVPRKTTHVNPVCPSGGATGDVVVLVEGHIGVDGLITDITPTGKGEGTDPPAEFYESVRDAVQQWEFTPTLLNKVPVEVAITVMVTFKSA